MTLASEEDPLWSKPCLAYNVHAELNDACRDDLVRVQHSLRLPGSWALICPPASLHVSVATMLSVREDYGTSKDAIWANWGKQWCDSLAELVAGLRPFEVRFTKLHVSTAAVIALAEPVPEVDEVRERARQFLSRAGLKPRPTVYRPLHAGPLWCLWSGFERPGERGSRCSAQRRDDSGVPRGVKRTGLPEPCGRNPGPPALGDGPCLNHTAGWGRPF